MLTIFFFIAVSIFIPPFWFVTLGYIIYLITTRKQRRDKVIMHEIRQLIAQKREQTLLAHLYFDSAKSFVIDHGATTHDPSEDRLDIELNIDGEDYQITLQRQENEETLLSVCAAENVEKKQKSIAAEVPLLFKDSA